uniref:Ammonium transporter AmtB-like domain-containing protein n=2 Tax=Dendroctonus ponderosae TaxID=77166 RepID=A0AAR5QIN7_DENPD
MWRRIRSPILFPAASKKLELLKFSLLLLFIQCFLFVLFVAFGAYSLRADASSPGNSITPVFGGFNHARFNIVARFQPMFQDIHVMVFIGFGFLMVFLKRYGYSSLGFNYLLAAISLQWSILCQGFFELNDDYKIEIGMTSLYRADIATVLISMGAVLGRVSHIQLIVMSILEIAAYSVNYVLNEKYFKAVDVGGSILVHTFGAYFGLSVSYILGRQQKCLYDDFDLSVNLQKPTYTSNILAMIETLFLWVYWPSFNSIDLENDRAHRAVINTYLAMAASCVIAFAASQLSSKEHTFNMIHVQNSTLPGGVAIGACAHLMVQPFGALLIGMIAGFLSVYGYNTVSFFLKRRLAIEDTCGVHNLHGIPGAFGGITAILLAYIATEQQYGKTLYQVYQARASPEISPNTEYIVLETGDGRTASQQAGYQTLLLVVTILMATVSGLISGFIVSLRWWGDASPETFYEDSVFWELPSEQQEVQYHPPPTWKLKEKLYNNSNVNMSVVCM